MVLIFNSKKFIPFKIYQILKRVLKMNVLLYIKGNKKE